MAQPILINTKAFDANFNHTLTFTNMGNNQAYKNRLVIKNNATNATVYDQTVTTNLLQHTIAGGSIKKSDNTVGNGICYSAQIQAIDFDGVATEFSNPIIFYCYTNPTFSFSNITSNQIIKNSSYTVNLSYTQPEGEKLNEYTVCLYKNDEVTQIWTSGVLTYSSGMTVTITSLLDKQSLYIRATGQTTKLMDVDTGYIPISVKYENPAQFSRLEVDNIYEDGTIRLATNFVIAEGTSSPSPPTYINNEKVNLTQTGSYVAFSSGFCITDDFFLQLIGENLVNNQIVISLSNGINTITVQYCETIFYGETIKKGCFILRVPNGVTYRPTRSEYFTLPTSGQQVTLNIIRKNNTYELEVS